jgi:hypothetical protein
MIQFVIDLLSTSKPSSKTTKHKPKSVSDPQNDHDNNKEARKATKIACSSWLVGFYKQL